MKDYGLPHTIIKLSNTGVSREDVRVIYQQFTEECVRRITWISFVVCLGELILLILDMNSGFFAEHPVNGLNLLAELVIIVSALLARIYSRSLEKKKTENINDMVKLIYVFKGLIFIAVSVFIFTDIYARQTPLGSYIVFFFIFQIVPFYHAKGNIVLFGSYIVMILFCYLFFVPNVQPNHLFSICAIILAFGLSEEFIRAFMIKSIVNNHVSLVMSKRFETLASQTIQALSDAVEAKDLYTNGHSKRVATYSCEIARRMGYSQEKIDEVYYIGLLHDIGKIGVRDSVINKAGRLTDEEYEEIKEHPRLGYDILKNVSEISDISLGARWHHERYDGNGYPDGLKGEEIPVIARIIAVADAYDAMTSNRSYRTRLSQAYVREEIAKNSGRQFAPEIAKIMLEMIDEDNDYTMHE